MLYSEGHERIVILRRCTAPVALVSVDSSLQLALAERSRRRAGNRSSS